MTFLENILGNFGIIVGASLIGFGIQCGKYVFNIIFTSKKSVKKEDAPKEMECAVIKEKIKDLADQL